MLGLLKINTHSFFYYYFSTELIPKLWKRSTKAEGLFGNVLFFFILFILSLLISIARNLSRCKIMIGIFLIMFSMTYYGRTDKSKNDFTIYFYTATK